MGTEVGGLIRVTREDTQAKKALCQGGELGPGEVPRKCRHRLPASPRQPGAAPESRRGSGCPR